MTGTTWSGGYKDFAYDNAGRMTEYDNNGSVRYFTYDEEGRMTGISGAYTASYTYNGLRTRTSKTENSVTNDFRRDGSGVTSPVLNDGSASYTPGISERRGSTTTYLNSGIKNAEAQTSTSQTIAAERTYDAFGNLTATSGTWQGPFGHAGQFGYQEDSSGLQLLGHRFCDPTIGRFLTRDPIQDGRNWYTYCENNPIAAFDPDGLQTTSTPPGQLTYWLTLYQNYKDMAGATAVSFGTWLSQQGGKFQYHLVFPQQFRTRFEVIFGAGNSIDKYLMRIPEFYHKAIHKGKHGGWWNQQWQSFFDKNPNATQQDCLAFAKELLRQIGYDIRWSELGPKTR